MADPLTQLSREFLEFNHYIVRTETKFYKQGKGKGTPGDIDIIAVAPRRLKLGVFTLGKKIVGEAKNTDFKRGAQIDEVYEDKFRPIEKSWNQLREYVRFTDPSTSVDKVIFCNSAKSKVRAYALKKYAIKMITAGQMVRQLASTFMERGMWTYYPENYCYYIIRLIIEYLSISHRYGDELTLHDLVWIDPKSEPKLKKAFMERNVRFFKEFGLIST